MTDKVTDKYSLKTNNMNKEHLITKWQEKLSELNDTISENWSAQMDENHKLRQDKKIILEFIEDIEKLDLSNVICRSPYGTEFRFGQRVCSYDDKTTTGRIQYWDEEENCWCVKLDSGTHGMTWWPDDEPQSIENDI